jgi:hypothetical protein
MFVVKYDADGNLLWTRHHGSTLRSLGANGVSADVTGVYVAGFADGPTEPHRDDFVVKNDADGNVLWASQFGAAAADQANAVAADSSGAYVAGWTDGALPGQTSAGSTDAFVAKYDADGNLLWTRQFGDPALDEEAFGVSADGSGVYVTGNTTPILRKYDPDGNLLWTGQFAGIGNGVSADGSGVYVVGDPTFVAKFRIAPDQPPVIHSLRISSSTGGVVSTGSVLTAHVTGSDPDGEAVSYAYQWYRNGTAIAGATSNTLQLGVPGAGGTLALLFDTITVRVTPSDATAAGTAASASVTVTDAPPEIQRLTITSSGPAGAVTTTSLLTAHVTGFDPDGETV